MCLSQSNVKPQLEAMLFTLLYNLLRYWSGGLIIYDLSDPSVRVKDI